MKDVATRFSLDRASKVGLAVQLANMLRQAILSGYYKAGDGLPTILEWAKLLKVSIRVPEAAIATLVREGLVTARKRYGCTVNARRTVVWQGRILIVVPDGVHVFYQGVMVDRLRARFAAEGYLVTQVTVYKRPSGKYDCAQLEMELKTAPDFVLMIDRRTDIETHLLKSGLQFGLVGPPARPCPGCALNFPYDLNAAVPDFVAHCKAAGVRSVLQVRQKGSVVDAVGALRDAGIRASEWLIPVIEGCGRIEGVQRGALAAFSRRFAQRGRKWLPDVLFFADDYVAAGALTALLMEGVHIPRDVRVVSIANAGLGPVYPMALTRMVNDGAEIGNRLADAVQRLLAGRKVRVGDCVGMRYVVGETFPKCGGAAKSPFGR